MRIRRIHFVWCVQSGSFPFFHILLTCSFQAIKPFDEDNTQVWIVDKGSSMCLYDDRYYFLKFKKDNSGTIQLRYNLPPAMDQKLKELVELARTPEEQQGVCRRGAKAELRD